jgi:hypothetical protein
MAHFAKINKNSGRVERVIVVSNNDCGGGDFPESEAIGQNFIDSVLKDSGTWKQTSYNNNFRVRYAGVGYTYDEEHDAFIPPKPYPSWVLNETSLLWNPPVPMPNDGKVYEWNESIVNWVEVVMPEEPVEETPVEE